VKLTPKQREELRMMFGGKCAYCGCDLPEKGWHADHVEPIHREWWKREPKISYEVVDGAIISHEEKQVVGLERPENDTLDNLFPACRACNLDKRVMSLESWRGVLANKVNVCRYASAFRHAERFGLVQIVDKPVVFWFEKYNLQVVENKEQQSQ
jgi:5-methylcytosine-specific restriction endonuclease McrA